jgi:DNA adenine methylase
MKENNGYLVDRDLLQIRACSIYSALPRPFLRWAGSKRWLLKHLVEYLPSRFQTYREPFLGSGALFFLLRPYNAALSDTCSELIDAYRGITNGVSTIIRHLRPMKPDRELYYTIRNRRSSGPLKRTAQFVYLNKTCWNGLYRVNSEGRFNVPYGMPRSETIADFDNLRACSQVLRGVGVTLRSCDFDVALEDAGAGDLVYLDPPYVTRHNGNGFIDYNETLFSWEDQKRLAQRARQLAREGAYVIVTNANYRDVVDLYKGFKCRIVTRSSTLASDSRFRVPVKEAILYSRSCIGKQ